MTLQCAVIDDEPLAREGIGGYISEVDFLELAGTGSNPLELQTLLGLKHIDLIFLDIRMPVMSGLDFLRMSKDLPMVIITTALPNHALEGFELDVLDYLVKPVSFNRFFQAVNKAKDYHQLQTKAAGRKDYFFIKCDYKFERIDIDDILYVEALQNYVSFVTKHGKFMTLMSLKSAEEHLDPKSFIRVHKSYLVAIDKIGSIENNEIVISKTNIPISRSYRDIVLEKVINGRLLRRE